MADLKHRSQYEKRYYCAKCGRWYHKKDVLTYKGEYAYANDTVFKRHVYPVCPRCLKRVRTTAHHKG